MVTDLSKGLSIYGYQIVTQLLAYMSPAVVLGDLSKYAELLAENQGRPLRCLAVLWALGQCGHKVMLRYSICLFLDCHFCVRYYVRRSHRSFDIEILIPLIIALNCQCFLCNIRTYQLLYAFSSKSCFLRSQRNSARHLY